MRVSWVWVAMAAIYFVSAWIVATALIGAFLAGLNFSLASASFVAPYLLILRCVPWFPRYRQQVQ